MRPGTPNATVSGVRDGKRRVAWFGIATAPRDGSLIMARRTYADRLTGRLKYEKHRTFWGKTSHVPLYGWNWGRDIEDLELWAPTHWRPIPSDKSREAP